MADDASHRTRQQPEILIDASSNINRRRAVTCIQKHQRHHVLLACKAARKTKTHHQVAKAAKEGTVNSGGINMYQIQSKKPRSEAGG